MVQEVRKNARNGELRQEARGLPWVFLCGLSGWRSAPGKRATGATPGATKTVSEKGATVAPRATPDGAARRERFSIAGT